jgi:hypothetical protein
MPSAKEYRAYVDKCLGWAECAETDDERDIFLQMAKGWLEAALIASGASPGPTAWTKSPSDEDGSATAALVPESSGIQRKERNMQNLEPDLINEEQTLLRYEISDEALEASAFVGASALFTLGNCTGLGSCPA